MEWGVSHRGWCEWHLILEFVYEWINQIHSFCLNKSTKSFPVSNIYPPTSNVFAYNWFVEFLTMLSLQRPCFSIQWTVFPTPTTDAVTTVQPTVTTAISFMQSSLLPHSIILLTNSEQSVSQLLWFPNSWTSKVQLFVSNLHLLSELFSVFGRTKQLTITREIIVPVSYTHLTLPTILLV